MAHAASMLSSAAPAFYYRPLLGLHSSACMQKPFRTNAYKSHDLLCHHVGSSYVKLLSLAQLTWYAKALASNCAAKPSERSFLCHVVLLCFSEKFSPKFLSTCDRRRSAALSPLLPLAAWMISYHHQSSWQPRSNAPNGPNVESCRLLLECS